MPRKTVFIKVSGDLVDKINEKNILIWLKTITQKSFTAICTGGGKQINEAFKERGYPIEFGPQGRITNTFEERQLARDVLEQNQTLVQDLLAKNGIMATVIIPVLDIASVLNHINGDDIARFATGYDEAYILTLKSRARDKKKQFSDCPKIRVKGF